MVKRAVFVLLISAVSANAETQRESNLEVGLERFVATAPPEAAAFAGLLVNYWMHDYFYIGTTQMSLTYQRQSEYRPDFRLGVLFPLAGDFFLEAALGVDFFTALLILLVIADEDNEIDYKFVSSFYSPYFTLTSSIRWELGNFALKLIGQTQFGGYLDNQNQAFNASLWLGLGATYRFHL